MPLAHGEIKNVRKGNRAGSRLRRCVATGGTEGLRDNRELRAKLPDDWVPIAVAEWRPRMKWHDLAETVMDWDCLLYDGWEPIDSAHH